MGPESVSLILTEEQITREGIKSLLLKEPAFTIIGETATGKEVLELLNRGMVPSMVVMDVTLPDMDCITLTESIKKNFPDVKTIVLGTQINDNYVVKAFKAGVNSCLLKSMPLEELMFAIKHVHQSNTYLCSAIMQRFMKRLTSVAEPSSPKKDLSMNFSSREIEILTLISVGHTNQEIAERLFTSKRTIENHRQALIDKTGSRNIVSLVRFAIVNGLIG